MNIHEYCNFIVAVNAFCEERKLNTDVDQEGILIYLPKWNPGLQTYDIYTKEKYILMSTLQGLVKIPDFMEMELHHDLYIYFKLST